MEGKRMSHMKISAPADDREEANLHSRRTFLAGTTAAAVAGAVGLGQGLLNTAWAAKSAAGDISPTGGPVSKVTAAGKIVQLDPKPLVTPMFTSTNVVLGREEVISGTGSPDSLCPLVSMASVDPGMKYPPHMHDGYGLLVLMPGMKPANPGSRSTEPVQINFDGGRVMREFNKGGVAPPEGAREFVIFSNGYSSIPLFKDLNDPLVKSFYESLPDGGAEWRTRPVPPAWKNRPAPTPHPLDRVKHARTANGVTTYLCQVGPLAWSADFDYYDLTPYIALMEFEPNAAMPSSWRNGWSGVGVIDGTVDIAGVRSTEGAFVLFEPLARHGFKAGPKGATAIMFFDSGRATFPVWDKPSDAAPIAFDKALRIPS
jgi:hypothetical protein